MVTEAFVKTKAEDYRRIFFRLIEQEEEHEANLKELLNQIKSEIELDLRKTKNHSY